jgi:hypothetical protein
MSLVCGGGGVSANSSLSFSFELGVPKASAVLLKERKAEVLSFNSIVLTLTRKRPVSKRVGKSCLVLSIYVKA